MISLIAQIVTKVSIQNQDHHEVKLMLPQMILLKLKSFKMSCFAKFVTNFDFFPGENFKYFISNFTNITGHKLSVFVELFPSPDPLLVSRGHQPVSLLLQSYHPLLPQLPGHPVGGQSVSLHPPGSS